jgi:hypothetical protein
MRKTLIGLGLFLIAVGLSCSLMFPLANLMPVERPGGQFIPGAGFIMLPLWCLSLGIIWGILSLMRWALTRTDTQEKKKKKIPPQS